MADMGFNIGVVKQADDPVVIVRGKVATKKDDGLIGQFLDRQLASACQVVMRWQAAQEGFVRQDDRLDSLG